MSDYKKMYSTLFNAITDAVQMLKAATAKTEEIYIEGEEIHLELHKQEAEKATDE